MYGLNALTGDVLWKYDSGGSVVDSPSIVNGMLFWGSGYSHIRPGVPNNKMFAFALPGNGE
jgi:polyvinyl alcohol dehydrogenase (cytochrome)